MPQTPTPGASTAPIYWMALGTFAIGAEGFMISPLLPNLAASFNVSVPVAGQLVTAFALTYAISSPILTALAGSLDRRKLLIFAMAAFATSNVFAANATGYWSLMGARILLATAAGVYVPSATALAGALVAPERRGRALATVVGGTTVAIAFGVPLGAAIGHGLGWRATFAGVAVLASIASFGLLFGLPKNVGLGLPAASLRERVAVIGRPAILLSLLVTTIWATGAFTVYTYLAPYLALAARIGGARLSAVLFVWGLSAAAGLFVGGAINDRLGSRWVLAPSLSILALAFLSLSITADLLSPAHALAPVLLAIVVWGLTAWGFFPAQQARLIRIGGLKVAPIALSLNASFMNLGFSLGAALGSLTLSSGSASDLGWVGGLCEIAAALLILAISRPSSSAQALVPVTPDRLSPYSSGDRS